MDFSKVLVNGLWLARIFLIVDEGLHAMAKFGTETFLSFGWTGNNKREARDGFSHCETFRRIFGELKAEALIDREL